MAVKHKAIEFNIKAIPTSLGHESEPLIYGTPESPARIEGEVVLECNYECKGTIFVLTYAAVVDVSVNTVQDYHTDATYFDQKVFQYELQHPRGRPNHLTPNIYRFPFAFNVSSDYPSSFDSNGARMRYLLEGRLVRRRSRAFKKTVIVHVHNTAVSRDLTEPRKVAISSLLPWSPSETTLVPVAAVVPAAELKPTLQRFPGVWAGGLPYEVILPTLTLLWGQIIPITIRIYHLSDCATLSSESNSPSRCPLPVDKVVKIKVSTEQERVIHAGVSVCTSRHEGLQAVWDGFSDGWPELSDFNGHLRCQSDETQAHSLFWQKVLLFQVPLENAPKTLPPTIDCKCLKINYILKVTLDLMPAPGKKLESIKIPVKMAVPRPPNEPAQSFNMDHYMACLASLTDKAMAAPNAPLMKSF
ncbi:hypothetical protein BGZ72_006526 [Mortierella alpina]|nr:hypothetical protein BGZ72_006526 [Mortierella alpina]